MQPFIIHIIVILAGLIALLFSMNFQSNLKRIKQNGEEAKGIVFDFTQGKFNSNDSSNSQYPIIRFVTKKQQWITKASIL